MQGHPHKDGRASASEQDGQWQSAQDECSESLAPGLHNDRHRQVQAENRNAQALTPRTVDSAILLLKTLPRFRR